MDNLFEDIFKKLQRTLYSPDLRKLMQTRDNYKAMFSSMDLKKFTVHDDEDAGRPAIGANDQLTAPAELNITRRK